MSGCQGLGAGGNGMWLPMGTGSPSGMLWNYIGWWLHNTVNVLNAINGKFYVMFTLSQFKKQANKWDRIFFSQCLLTPSSLSEQGTKMCLTLSCFSWLERQQELLVPQVCSHTVMLAQLATASACPCFPVWGLSPAAEAQCPHAAVQETHQLPGAALSGALTGVGV